MYPKCSQLVRGRARAWSQCHREMAACPTTTSPPSCPWGLFLASLRGENFLLKVQSPPEVSSCLSSAVPHYLQVASLSSPVVEWVFLAPNRHQHSPAYLPAFPLWPCCSKNNRGSIEAHDEDRGELGWKMRVAWIEGEAEGLDRREPHWQNEWSRQILHIPNAAGEEKLSLLSLCCWYSDTVIFS